MTAQTWIDGVADTCWPLDDRGLRYGDGVFETMAAPNGRVLHWERHQSRLRRGCDALGIDGPDEATLSADLAHLDLSSPAVVRLFVTRGCGGAGYAPAPEAPSRRAWQVREWPSLDPAIARDGIRIEFLRTTLARQPALAGIKHLNRLEQVLAARELATLDADDGLLCDRSGAVIEAVSANVFVRHGSLVTTPPIDQCGVAGIVREVVLDAAPGLGIEIREQRLRRADVMLADEVFVTSSVRGVVPVRAIGNVMLANFQTAGVLRNHLDEQAGLR